MQQKSKWALMAPLCLVTMVDIMGVGIIFPVLAPMFSGQGGEFLAPGTSQTLHNVAYGAVIALFFLAEFFAAPMLGDLSDQLGRKKVLLGCLIVTAISFLISSFAVTIGSLTLLLLARLLSGVGAGSMSIAQAGIIDISTREDKALNLGIMTLCTCVGFVIGPIIGGFFSHSDTFTWFNYATPFYVGAFLAAFNAVLLYYTYQDSRPVNKSVKMDFAQSIRSLQRGFAIKSIRIYLIIFFILQMAWGIYFQYVSLFLAENYHYSPHQLGLFMGYLGLIFAFTSGILVRIVVKYFKLQTLVFMCLIAIFLCFFISMFFHSILAQWLAVIPGAVGVGLNYTGILTLISNDVPEENQGMVMGVTNSLFAVSWFIAGMVIGPFAAIGTNFPYVTASLLMVLTIIIFARRGRKAR